LAFATVVCAVVITIASVHIVSAAESNIEIQASDNNRNNDIDITRGKSPVQSLQQSLHVKLKGQDSNSFISSNTNRKLQARTNKKTKNNQSVKQQRGGGRLSNTQLSKLNNLHIHNSVLKQRNGVNKNNGSRGTNNTRTNAVKKRTSNTTVKKGAHLQSNKMLLEIAVAQIG